MYRRLSLLRLAELIARTGNRQALQELHNNRRVFSYCDQHPIRLVEFVDKLRQSKAAWRWCNGQVEVLDRAYDLTISKFSHLPTAQKNVGRVKQDGPDCRYYYAAFVRHATEKMKAETYKNKAEKEIWMAGLLQKLVIHHFRLSCLECGRANREQTRRYLWKLNGATLSLRLPIQIPGRQCSRWLAEHVPDVDPSRPGEQERVQAQVNRFVSRQAVFSLTSIDENEIVADLPACRSVTEQEIEINGLSGAVADEKADNIVFQRPAIQQLGKARLKALIHEIFESLAGGTYEATRLADGAGISRATFSRFAGSRWSRQTEVDRPVPDLWRNTAEALASHPALVRAAQTAGVWKRVEQIIETGNATMSGASNE